MVNVRVSTTVPAERTEVWNELAQLENHVEWMLDARAIRFLSDQRSGVGARFECATTLGPIRLTDVMEITEWVPGVAMGVRHCGAVTGTGRFSLTGARRSATVIKWEEQLSFPWWLGATLGGLVAKPLLAAMWKKNLRRMGHRIASVNARDESLP